MTKGEAPPQFLMELMGAGQAQLRLACVPHIGADDCARQRRNEDHLVNNAGMASWGPEMLEPEVPLLGKSKKGANDLPDGTLMNVLYSAGMKQRW
ncbi:hypothetical protein NDU88_000956 [Pleurodeles waltl]|uniref:Uncharacterized protein n=1 Tax=Pleurodeles waltl TaxID=8319 RepID=A0AAV7TGH8_PLEWA|nr:hypothetical protein NDU88_000956 [Pleurodeles waltl]